MLRKARVGQTASAGLLVAIGTGVGNVLAYGFNLVLSRGLGPAGYAELGTLLSVFLIGTVPGLAVQAINARRLAVAAEAPPTERAALVRGLRRRGLAVGGGVAALFVALAPAIAALLPSVTVGGVAWTGVSLAANTVFASYLGIAQGTSRFMAMTLLYLAAQGSRLAIGAAAAASQVSPTTVMAAQTAAWAFAAVAGRWMLRTEADGSAAESGLAAEASATPRTRVADTRLRSAVARLRPATSAAPTSAPGSAATAGLRPAAEATSATGPASATAATSASASALAGLQPSEAQLQAAGTSLRSAEARLRPPASVAATSAPGSAAAVVSTAPGASPATAATSAWQDAGPVAEVAECQSADQPTAHHGYLTEVLRATGGLGGILLLTVLDTLLASRYLTADDLGRYNTGALLARAAFFAPSFVAMLAYPRLARPAERRRALLTALALTGGIGVLGVAIAGVGRDPLIGLAFGQKYATPGGFDLGADGWLFTSVGALLALVNLALLDGVARRSHVVSAVVLGGIALEATVIVGFAHGSAETIVTAAAACSLATATVSVTACLMARTAVEVAAAKVEIEEATTVGAVATQST